MVTETLRTAIITTLKSFMGDSMTSRMMKPMADKITLEQISMFARVLKDNGYQVIANDDLNDLISKATKAA